MLGDEDNKNSVVSTPQTDDDLAEADLVNMQEEVSELNSQVGEIEKRLEQLEKDED